MNHSTMPFKGYEYGTRWVCFIITVHSQLMAKYLVMFFIRIPILYTKLIMNWNEMSLAQRMGFKWFYIINEPVVFNYDERYDVLDLAKRGTFSADDWVHHISLHLFRITKRFKNIYLFYYCLYVSSILRHSWWMPIWIRKLFVFDPPEHIDSIIVFVLHVLFLLDCPLISRETASLIQFNFSDLKNWKSCTNS